MQACTDVQLPLERDRVAKVKRPGFHKSPYVGIEGRFHRPNTHKSIDETNRIQANVEHDLENIISKIYTKTMESQKSNPKPLVPHIVLSGYKASDKKIWLSPTVWIDCNDEDTMKITKKYVAHLRVMSLYGLAEKIEVCVRPIWMTVNQSLPTPAQLKVQKSITLPRGYHMHLNSQRPDRTASACGLMCSFEVIHEDAPDYHGICRIGGILLIKEKNGERKTFGITAAHGLLDPLLASLTPTPAKSRHRRMLIDKTPKRRSTSMSGMPTTTAVKPWQGRMLGKMRHKLYSTSMSSMPTATAVIGELRSQEVQKVEWEPIESIGSINWLNILYDKTMIVQPSSFDDPIPNADFALLELPSEVFNTYCPDPTTMREVGHILMESQMSSESVYVIIAKNNVVKAKLLSGPATIYIRGIRFPTRKIQLDNPLGEYHVSQRCYTADLGHL
jgi:hypothetical protein